MTQGNHLASNTDHTRTGIQVINSSLLTLCRTQQQEVY